MQDYEINEKTLAILPFSNNKSIIYEDKDCYVLEKTVSKIMDASCRYYGSSIEGRQKGTANLTGITYKAPIIVSEENNVIFFPTTSPRLKECSWISLNNINKLHVKNNKIILEFLNKEKLELLISENIIKNQILKASLLESTIRKRNKI
ncbi:MAG: competence protein ComK [Bacilli bacterium]|nr:competence protein ComK [Bacilli bacterium]MDD4795134.1 competence protein ComK [Bacilli bacterium]